MSKTQVGVLIDTFLAWGGGIDFIANIINAMLEDPVFEPYLILNKEHKPFDFDNQSGNINKYGSLGDIFIARSNRKYIPRNGLDDLLLVLNTRPRIIVADNNRTALIQVLKRHQIKVVMPTINNFGKDFPVPWMAYVWDFQHKYFPEYFVENEIDRRNQFFKAALTDSSGVLVNSKKICNDLKKFYPKEFSRDKILVLATAPFPKKEWLAEPGDVLERYKLPKQYFLIANQFWIHKDHMTAIKGFSLIADKYPDVHLVCTGKMEEPRKPEYIDEVKNKIIELGLKDRVHLLGFIPKEDQIKLLRASLALIQPTLYEGGPGGGVTYNAASVGVRTVLSDIDINKEISLPFFKFFKAGSPSHLAKQLEVTIREDYFTPSNAELEEAGQQNLHRLRESISVGLNSVIMNFKESNHNMEDS